MFDLSFLQNVDSSASCSFDTTTNTLTLAGGFPSGLAAGDSFTFTVSTVRNPLSFEPVSISLSTKTESGSGTIEEGTATITASVQA